jgi:hypothetical protein
MKTKDKLVLNNRKLNYCEFYFWWRLIFYEPKTKKPL